MRRSLLAALVTLGLALTTAAGGLSAVAAPSRGGDGTVGRASAGPSTPARRVAVAYGLASLSIPPRWFVLYNEPPCLVGGTSGELFVDPLQGVFLCTVVSGEVPSTVVTFERQNPKIARGSLALRIHGIVLWRAARAYPDLYLVPSLHVQVKLSGPLAFSVLQTLERSPRHLVLAHGRVPRRPPTWRVVSFAGLRIALPAAWPVSRTDISGSDCSPLQGVEFLPPAAAVLDTDAHILYPPCPYEPPGQPPRTASGGVRIDERATYPVVPPSAFGHCIRIHRLHVCPASAPAFSILVVKVSVPGRARPVYVSIGLAGSGTTARTILYSLRPS